MTCPAFNHFVHPLPPIPAAKTSVLPNFSEGGKLPLRNGTHSSMLVPTTEYESCPTLDGRNPKQPPGMYKDPVNNGINYQPQLVITGS